MVLEVAVDGGLQVDDGPEDATPEALAGEFGEEAFNGVEPGTGFWGEVEGPARVTVKPGVDLAVGVCGVVIDNGMDRLEAFCLWALVGKGMRRRFGGHASVRGTR